MDEMRFHVEAPAIHGMLTGMMEMELQQAELQQTLQIEQLEKNEKQFKLKNELHYTRKWYITYFNESV